MKERDRLIILYDYYGDLLSDSQKKYFIDYFFDNLTIVEIAENNNVSKNAVSKELKLSTEKLLNYEEKLKMVEKDRLLRKIVNKIENEDLKKQINDILDE